MICNIIPQILSSFTDNYPTIQGFVDSGLTIGRMEKEGVSSKGENRGVGLSNVRKILSGYPKVYKTTYIEDRYFVQKLEIYNETRN